ncbi:MAG TPA: hypothetical protein VN611_02780 [Patescibacteria group bacterium]|nr:hypothetical protein [Patescibacteria group bacterium]
MKKSLFLLVCLCFMAVAPASAEPADPKIAASCRQQIQQEWNQAKDTYKGVFVFSRLSEPPYEYTKLAQQLSPTFKLDVQKTPGSPYSHAAVVEFQKSLLLYTATTQQLLAAEKTPKKTYTDYYILNYVYDNNQWVLKESKRYFWVFERWVASSYTSLYTAAKYDL